jgi:hypothetical protein
MGLGKVLGKVRKVLGVVTDLLLIGRGKGWWSEKNTPKPPNK